MSIVMQLQDVAESTRLGPLSGEVRAGEILHLVGPNGAGKSTLLARMAGMTSGKGSIQFAGQPLEAWSATKLALHRAYLSQQQTPPFAMPVWHYLTLWNQRTRITPLCLIHRHQQSEGFAPSQMVPL